MRPLITSLLVALCLSCTTYPIKKNFKPIGLSDISLLNPYFSDTSRDYVYKANINAFNNRFSGIFIVKKLGAEQHRIVFTTELGNKIFDFTFKGENFKVNHILKDLDKKPLINILKKDFKILVTESPILKNTFSSNDDTIYQTNFFGKKHFYFSQQKQLYKITKVVHTKPKVEFLFSGINNTIARQIQISHKNFNLKIELKAF